MKAMKAPIPRHRPIRLAALALAVFGFAASLTAFASDDLQCAQCHAAWQHCLMTVESPNQSVGCDRAFAACVRTLDCPVMED